MNQGYIAIANTNRCIDAAQKGYIWYTYTPIVVSTSCSLYSYVLLSYTSTHREAESNFFMLSRVGLINDVMMDIFFAVGHHAFPMASRL